MNFHFPGLEIREPLRSRPIAGALFGTVLGALFGLLAPEADFQAQRQSILLGYLCGGLVGGLVIGSGIPMFRNRLVAGIIVAGGVSLGLAVSSWLWNEPWGFGVVTFLGAMCGFVYAVLLWDYHGGKPEVESEDT
jgi:hypothetical protein